MSTPYVTPHILHENYAAAVDYESQSHRECSRCQPSSLRSLNRTYPFSQSSAATSPTSRRGALLWTVASSSATHPSAQLYEDAIRNEGAVISPSGALEDGSKDNIWWGSVNIKMDERESSPALEFAVCWTDTGCRYF
jgi:phosphoenolpyruvate carboxykinase (ATP)